MSIFQAFNSGNHSREGWFLILKQAEVTDEPYTPKYKERQVIERDRSRYTREPKVQEGMNRVEIGERAVVFVLKKRINTGRKGTAEKKMMDIFQITFTEDTTTGPIDASSLQLLPG